MNLVTDMSSRYDRQSRAWGEDSTNKILNSSVIIYGLDNIAVEIAKNLSLIGIKTINLYDNNLVTQKNVNNCFYYNQDDIGQIRSKVIEQKIKQLNPYNTINILNECNFSEFSNSTVIVSNLDFERSKNINKLCRQYNQKFIMVKSAGLAGIIFVDFGENFVVSDIDGENYKSFQIKSIEKQGKNYLVTSIENHNLEKNSLICFNQCQFKNSNDNILNQNYRVSKIVNIKKFEIKLDVSEFTFLNGSCNRIKESKNFKFETLESQLVNPNFQMDLVNPDLPESILDFFVNLENYSDILPWNNDLIKSDSLYPFYNSSFVSIPPVASILGSLTANEVVKAVTQKYLPVNQWLTWSDISIHPSNEPSDTCSENYLEALFGKQMIKQMEDSSWLVVGSGAIGCELLKNMAMMNLSTGSGVLKITDPDHIEKSNLCRQFLFRSDDIGKSKSEVAVKAVNVMNPRMNLISYQDKVTFKNQQLTDSLFSGVTGVFNALDNLEARLYVDSQCVIKNKPLFESGTMGNKGNTQVVIPKLTESYGSSKDPENNEDVPVCTLKNFPNKVEHTIHYALDYFSEFDRVCSNINRFVESGKSFLDDLGPRELPLAKKDIYQFVFKNPLTNFRSCAEYAMDVWNEYFRNKPMQLLHNFPPESLRKDGKLFWSEGKRCPVVQHFDFGNENHLDFIESMTRILVNLFQLNNNFTRIDIVAKLADYQSPQYTCDDTETAVTEEQAKKQEDKLLEDQEINIPDEIPESFKDKILVSQEFEKDDDSNNHVAFITAMSNCRCLNYGIKPISRNRTKGIAGNIIPAVATTTSLVAGFISLELYKYFQEKNLESYNNYFLNLSLNLIVPSDPISPEITKIGERKTTIWDKFSYTLDSSLQQFINYWDKYFGVTINAVLIGSCLLYASFLGNKNNKELLSKLIEKKVKKNPSSQDFMVTISSDEEENLPCICLSLKKEFSLSTGN